ncbi:GAF domain-containing protein [Salinibacterium sp. GXW1014]|uniref:GAF domain-containing protein n=1 Tax=Salinibacterium sp. GXW1014 TaxID=3377838 RepID=UPI00383B1D4D
MTPAEPPVFRAPMRSRDHSIPDGAAVERALKVGVCGVGGRLSRVPARLADAAIAVASEHDERIARRLERFTDAPDGSYIWTRDVDGVAWLGRLAGSWRYDDSREAHDVDLVHVRPCEWVGRPVPEASVPPAAQLTFRRGGRNWQQTHDPHVSAQTAAVWREMTKGPDAAASDPLSLA